MASRTQLGWTIAGTILLSLGVYLVGNGVTSLFDRDEPRYAECSREMLKGSSEHPGSNWVVPRFLGELRTAKPPGIYWAQGFAMSKLGDNVFAARLPSAIAMTIVLTLFAIATWKLVGPSRAAWATFILATSVMTIVSAKACLTDAVLLIFITAAHLCLYATYRGRGGWGVTILWCICIGLAGLVKGPVIFAVQGMTIILLAILHTFTNRPRSTTVATIDPERQFLATVGRFFLGLAIIVAIVGPWLWAINRDEPTFLPRILGHDVVDRALKSGLEGHTAPPGYHLVTIWGTYFPWSIFLPMMLVFAFKRRHLPIIRFSLATMIGNFIFFECVKTKLPHYLLPIYPWMALMTADAFVRCLRGVHKDLINGVTRNALTVWGVIVILLGALPWGFGRWFAVPVVPTLEWTITTAIIGAIIIFTFRTRRPQAGLIMLGVGSFAMVTVLFGLYLPRVDFLRTSILVGDELKRLGVTAPGSVEMLDYKEPSLAFYQGGTIRENSNTILTARLVENPKTPAYLVITNEVWDKSDPAVQTMYDVLSTYPTLAYADSMRRIKVMIIHRK